MISHDKFAKPTTLGEIYHNAQLDLGNLPFRLTVRCTECDSTWVDTIYAKDREHATYVASDGTLCDACYDELYAEDH